MICLWKNERNDGKIKGKKANKIQFTVINNSPPQGIKRLANLWTKTFEPEKRLRDHCKSKTSLDFDQ